MKPEFDKPVAEMTLSEVKAWCYGYRKKYADADACEETGCPLYERGICAKEWVHEWDLEEKPRFTDAEREAARAIKLLYPASEHVQRDGCFVVVWNLKQVAVTSFLVEQNLFPSLRNGEFVALDVIINDQN